MSHIDTKKGILTEYDETGNLVADEDKIFYVDQSKDSLFLKSPEGLVIDQSYVAPHYFTLLFKDGVTILDGTTNGSTADVLLTVKNISVLKKRNVDFRIVYDNFVIGTGPAYYDQTQMDLNIKVLGVSNKKALISFIDIDCKDKETIFLLDGFDKNIYTLPLTYIEENRIALVKSQFMETEEGYLSVFASSPNTDNSTYQSGFVTTTNLPEEGLDLRWKGWGCGTILFNETRAFKLKTTINQSTSESIDGSISQLSDWKYRNYGEAKVITITPNEGYHIRNIKIDNNTVKLSDFDNNGYYELVTGYTEDLNTGTETVQLYQRANGVVDVYLPKQFFAIDNLAPVRSDHWIDVNFEGNGSDSY